jgi:hypothetical protein
MPRNIPVGNGSLLVNFDRTYQLRDLYWPTGQQTTPCPAASWPSKCTPTLTPRYRSARLPGAMPRW